MADDFAVVADFEADFLVVFRVVAGTCLAADLLVGDFGDGVGAGLAFVEASEVDVRAGDVLVGFAAVFDLSAASSDGSTSWAILPGSSATCCAFFANRLAAFCICFAADSATATDSSSRTSSFLIRLSTSAALALTTDFCFLDDFSFATGFDFPLDFVFALGHGPSLGS